MIRRLIALAATTAAAAALALSGASPAAAAPSLGVQGLACGNGWISTAAPGGSAMQNTWNSGRADATWDLGVFHYTASGWQFGWSSAYVSTVASNGGFDLGTIYGSIGAWRQVGGNGSVVTQVSLRAVPGDYYAVISYVMDSDTGVWSWSQANGSVVCRA